MANKVPLRGKLQQQQKPSPAVTGSFARPPAAGTPAAAPLQGVAREGVRGLLPLPANQVMQFHHLSPEEKAVLAPYGYQDGQAIPADFAQALSEIRGEHQQDLDNPPLPGDPDKPPPPLVLPPEQKLSDLPQNQQDYLRKILADAQPVFAQQQAEQARQVAGAHPSVNEAIRQLHDGNVQLADDLDRPTFADTGMPKQAEATAGSKPAPTICPKCSHNLQEPLDPEPSVDDRENFLQAFCGGQPFSKQYSIMDNAMWLTIRELTTYELDAVWQQAYRDKQDGHFSSSSPYAEDVDRMERVMRYRHVLQITKLSSPRSQLNEVLPESLDGWIESLASLVPAAEQPTLRDVWDYMVTNVLKTESLMVAASNLVARFNRLTDRLEENRDTPGFYTAKTEGH